MNVLKKYILEVLSGFKVLNSIGRDRAIGNLRYKDATLSQKNRGILDDEEDNEQYRKQNIDVLPQAVRILVIKNGKILTISRKNEPTSMQLPGSICSATPGKSIEEIAISTLSSLTGLSIIDPIPVFSDIEVTGYYTTTFVGKIVGKIKDSDEETIAFVCPKTLIDPNFCMQSKYNVKLLSKLGYI